jgi:hypothetical protein
VITGATFVLGKTRRRLSRARGACGCGDVLRPAGGPGPGGAGRPSALSAGAHLPAGDVRTRMRMCATSWRPRLAQYGGWISASTKRPASQYSPSSLHSHSIFTHNSPPIRPPPSLFYNQTLTSYLSPCLPFFCRDLPAGRASYDESPLNASPSTCFPVQLDGVVGPTRGFTEQAPPPPTSLQEERHHRPATTQPTPTTPKAGRGGSATCGHNTQTPRHNSASIRSARWRSIPAAGGELRLPERRRREGGCDLRHAAHHDTDEMAAAVMFLACDEATSVTGMDWM